MAQVLDCGLEVSKFEFQLHYYIHFWIHTLEKSMNPFIPAPNYGLNSTTALPLLGWLWYLSKVKLATIVEGNQKAPFSIATTPRCWGGHYSFPRIAPLHPLYISYIAEC